MGRIRFDTAVTLNGFLADEHHSLSWLFAVPGSDDAERDIPTPDAAVDVMGSHTYEWLLRELDMLEHPEKWTEFFGSTPVYVFTSRMLPVPAGVEIRFVDGSVATALPGIREAAGDGDIWVMGGGDLVGQFLDAGALDEIAVTIAPVTLEGGAPLLPRRLESDRMRLVEARPVGQFVRAVYEVRPAAS
ncbi:MAG TPA: dihydrofolate reductase family protein [Protaetiibacter sp.]|nr:dihydrofolate reductase family protein [Protaetiibacter sp.]